MIAFYVLLEFMLATSRISYIIVWKERGDKSILSICQLSWPKTGTIVTHLTFPLLLNSFLHPTPIKEKGHKANSGKNYDNRILYLLVHL